MDPIRFKIKVEFPQRCCYSAAKKEDLLLANKITIPTFVRTFVSKEEETFFYVGIPQGCVFFLIQFYFFNFNGRGLNAYITE